MGRRLDREEVEARLGQRAEGRDDHGEMLRPGAGERGVGGDRFERRDALSWRERRDDLVGSTTTEDTGNPRPGGGQHGQAITPALGHHELLEGVEIVGPGNGLGRRCRGHRCRVARQRLHHGIHDPLGALAHVVGGDAADRMRDRDDGQMGQAERGRRRAAEGDERIRPEDDGGNPPPFQLRCVVDTPRRAGASVG